MDTLNRHGLLSVFVGAGVSQSCGLPGWQTLVARLTDRVPTSKRRFDLDSIKELDLVTRTRIVRELLGKSFAYEVAESLYAEMHTVSKTVSAIATLGVDRICSYNFDDILEEAMTIEGIGHKSVSPGQHVNNNYPGVIVYHIHGMLPSGASPEDCKDIEIVLDETDFNRLYSDPYSWANLVQLSMLISGSCLFIGCSMRDPNLRRLLDTCRRLNITHKHFAIMQSPVEGKKGDERANAAHQRNALKLELSSLNVEPVWIGKHSDIPDILNSIRNKQRSELHRKVGASPVRAWDLGAQ